MSSEIDSLLNYKRKIASLNEEEKKMHDLYLKKLASGIIEGPVTGYPSIDKPWLKYYDEEAIMSDLSRVSVYDLMKYNNKANLFNNALNYFGRRITYFELLENIDKAQKAFTKLGIKEGDVVSFSMPNIPETIYAFYALNKLGAVANMIDLRTNASRIQSYINDVDSKLLITVDAVLDKINEISPNINVTKTIIVSPSDSMDPVMKKLFQLKFPPKSLNDNQAKWSQFINDGKNEELSEPLYKKDMGACIIYTGGTTGNPKGALLSNESLTAMYVQQKYANPRMEKNDTLLGIMPPFIAYGIVYGINGPLTTGMEIILVPKFSIAEFSKLLVKHKPNHVIGVPAFWEQLVDDLKDSNIDLHFLKSCISGGAPISTATFEKISEFLKKHNAYDYLRIGSGLTECASSNSFMVDKENFIPTSAGIPLVKNNNAIVEVGTNKELPYNNVGEIVINSPTTMMKYINNPSETEKVLKHHEDGKTWIHSGDLGYIDKNGLLYLVGRMKDIIFRPDGHNVYPLKIEEVISSHYAVKNCLVVGIPCLENSNGLIPTAYIVLEDEYAYEKDRVLSEIIELNNKELPERDGALAFYIKDELPLTPVGKLDRKGLEEKEGKTLKLSQKLLY